MRTEHELKVIDGKNVFFGKERVHSVSKLTGWDNVESLECYLAYHYNRVYLNVTYIYNGIRLRSCQKPMQYMFDAEKEIAMQLFNADKNIGVISEDYKFN